MASAPLSFVIRSAQTESGERFAEKLLRVEKFPRAKTRLRFKARFSGGHTELSRVRGCFVIRLAERSGLFGKPIHLRLQELSLNLKELWETLGLAQLPYVFGGSGDVLLGIGFHFFG